MSKEIHIDLVVPEGQYYFLGDNRNKSYDARFWEEPFIDKDAIDGRAVKLLDIHRNIDTNEGKSLSYKE